MSRRGEGEVDRSIFVDSDGAIFGGAAAEQMHDEQNAAGSERRAILDLTRKPEKGRFFARAIPQYKAREKEARSALARAKRGRRNEDGVRLARRDVALAVYKRKISEELLHRGKLDGQIFADTLRSQHPEAFDEEMFWQAYNDAVDHLRR